MRGMFLGATSFNGDRSKWDVLSVKNMNDMFSGETHFKHKLYTTVWVHSKVSKDTMLAYSPGSISSNVCPHTTVVSVITAIQNRTQTRC